MIYILTLSQIFIYSEIKSIKISALIAVLIAIPSLFNIKNKIPPFTTIIILTLVAYTFLLSFFGKSLNVLFSTLFFIAIILLGSKNTNTITLKKIYVLTALICAIGVILQKIYFISTGNTFLTYYQYLETPVRNAFAFTWNDYSFLSLFIVSAVPFSSTKRPIISIILLTGSIVTTARTGIVSFVFIYSILYIYSLYKHIISHEKSYFKIIIIITTTLITIFFLPTIYETISGRSLNISDSNRLNDFIKGYDFFIENKIFGALLDFKQYSFNLNITAPHNLFIFALYIGGAIYFIIFLFFIFAIYLCTRYSKPDTITSLAICFIGLNFIPTPFSAYFIAILISLARVESENHSNKS